MQESKVSDYRVKETGELKTKAQLKAEFKNTSFPKTWNEEVLNFIGVNPVYLKEKPMPTSNLKVVQSDGVAQDANNNWVYAWVERDMFADTTEDGVTTTKAEHEAAYQAKLDAEAAKNVRTQRDAKLAETDWTGLSDVTMSAEMTTYRQALRDITSHADFPNLDDDDWPTKP